MRNKERTGRTGRTIRTVRTSAFCASCAFFALVPPLAAQSWRTVTSARQLHGERELNVTIQYGVGRFRLGPASSSQLYRMELRYDEDRFIPVREYSAAAHSITLGVRGREGTRVSIRDTRRSEQTPSMDVALTPDVPLVLEMNLGAVEAAVELGGLAVRRATYRTGASESRLHWSAPNPVACEELRMEAGAAEFTASGLGNSNCAALRFDGGLGEITLDFNGSWRNSMDASVNMGIGSLQLRLPRNVGVAVTVSRFLASFDGAGFTKRGNTYYSPNYNESRQRLTLHISTSIGGIEVAWID